MMMMMMMMIAVPNQRAGNQIRQERHSAARWAINISSFAFRVSLLSRHVMLIKWWFWLRNQSFSQLQTGDSQKRLALIPDSPRKTGKEKRREKTTFLYMGDQFHCSCIKQHNCFRFAEIAMQSKLTRDCFQWKYFESLQIMVTDPKLGNADISTCTTLWRKGFWVIWAMPERNVFSYVTCFHSNAIYSTKHSKTGVFISTNWKNLRASVSGAAQVETCGLSPQSRETEFYFLRFHLHSKLVTKVTPEPRVQICS